MAERENPKVDEFLRRAKKWNKEMAMLRDIVLSCGLMEELKWGKPCYTYEGRNIVLIHGFKDYCALLFMKGTLLKDTHRLLIQQTENVQAGRQIRFTGLEEIRRLAPVLTAYTREAIETEKAGLVVKTVREDWKIPQELQEMFDENPDFQAAFERLTPGRRRGYLYHYTTAKQAKTRIDRIEKSMPHIFAGRGLND